MPEKEYTLGDKIAIGVLTFLWFLFFIVLLGSLFYVIIRFVLLFTRPSSSPTEPPSSQPFMQ
jgi:hypothetical protein